MHILVCLLVPYKSPRLSLLFFIFFLFAPFTQWFQHLQVHRFFLLLLWSLLLNLSSEFFNLVVVFFSLRIYIRVLSYTFYLFIDILIFVYESFSWFCWFSVFSFTLLSIFKMVILNSLSGIVLISDYFGSISGDLFWSFDWTMFPYIFVYLVIFC